MFKKNPLSRRRKALQPVCGSESLEDRRLLAVSVTASGTTARIIGSSNADDVQLIGFSVIGLNGTVVNIDDSFDDNKFDIKSYLFEMKGGNDSVQVNNVFDAKLISVKGGAGNNTTIVRDTDTMGLLIENETGSDVNIIQRVQVGPNGQRNGGALSINNGDGGSETTISSNGPGSGQSMHTSKILVQNGKGSNVVSFNDIRLRQAKVVVVQGEGANVTSFNNVDRVKGITVKRDASVPCCLPGGLSLVKTKVESGNVLLISEVEDPDVGSGSILTVSDDSTVSGNLLHKAVDVDFSSTSLRDDSLVEKSLKVFNKDVREGHLTIENAGVAKTTLFDNDFRTESVGNSSQVQLLGSVFGSTVKVQNTRVGSLDLDVDNTLFGNALLVKHADGGSNGKIIDAEVNGNFLYQARAGNDKLTIDDSLFEKKVTIKTDGKSLADFTDEDEIEIERDTGLAANGDSRFNGPVSIATGRGDDCVEISGNSLLSENVADFRKSVKINGGAEHDIFARGAWAVFQIDPKLSGFEVP